MYYTKVVISLISIVLWGHAGPVVVHSPADREVCGSNPTLDKCEFLNKSSFPAALFS